MMPTIHFRLPENERSEFRCNQNERSAFRRRQNAPHTFQPIIRRLTLAAHPHRGLFQSKGLSDLRASGTRGDGATG